MEPLKSNKPAAISVASDETLEFDRLQKVIALETASVAQDYLVRWVLYVAAPITLVLAIVGITTYTEFRSVIADAKNEINLLKSSTVAEILADKESRLKEIDELADEVKKVIAENRKKSDDTLAIYVQYVQGLPRQAETGLVASTAQYGDTAQIIQIFDAGNGRDLPGKPLNCSSESEPAAIRCQELFEKVKKIYSFLRDVMHFDFQKDGGMQMKVTLNYDNNYNNSFWDGSQVVLGNGDGITFQRLDTIDLLGGEFAHGVIQKRSPLVYQGDTGALQQHLSNVFGILVKQWDRKVQAKDDTWVLGEGIFVPTITGKGLVTFKDEPAYDDAALGLDPQPKHFKDYVKMTGDNGGIHTNSGILNHAFYEAALKEGGFAWEKVGKIWFEASGKLTATSDWNEFVQTTVSTAKELYGDNSQEVESVKTGWESVGLL